MNLLEKSDDEIIAIANPIWDNLVKTSNMKDYGGFTRDFGTQMLFGANEVELGKQWANNKLLSSLKEDYTGIWLFKKRPKHYCSIQAEEVKRLKVSSLEDWCLVLRVMISRFLEQPSTNKKNYFISNIYLTNN